AQLTMVGVAYGDFPSPNNLKNDDLVTRPKKHIPSAPASDLGQTRQTGQCLDRRRSEQSTLAQNQQAFNGSVWFVSEQGRFADLEAQGLAREGSARGQLEGERMLLPCSEPQGFGSEAKVVLDDIEVVIEI